MASHSDDAQHDHGLALVFGPDSASATAGRIALWLATLVAGLLAVAAVTDLGIDADAVLVAAALAAGPALGTWVAGYRAGVLFTGLVVAAPLAGAAGAYLVLALLGMAAPLPDVRLSGPALAAAGYLLVGTGLAFVLGRGVRALVGGR